MTTVNEHPSAAGETTVSTMHCMSVSLALSMLGDVGFKDVRVTEIESDPINYYYVATK
jgi:hypothetical protein